MSNKKEVLVFVVCIILVCAFIFILPELNTIVRDHKDLDEQLNEPEKVPTSYHCEMSKENEEYHYTMNQDATYTLSKEKKITKAVVKQTYQFETKEEFDRFQEEKISTDKIKGIDQTVQSEEDTLMITIHTTKVISEIPEDQLDFNFPKTYENLLIYTKDQTCKVSY